MIPRVNRSNPTSGTSTMRLIEPSEIAMAAGDIRCEPTCADVTPRIVFADGSRVMDSARRMMAVHQESFRKLAE